MNNLTRLRWPASAMARLILLWTALLALTNGSARAEQPRPGILKCAAGVAPEERSHCDEEALRQVESGSQSTRLDGGWRLVRSRNPDGGPDAISVMHVVDSAKSDARLAGLSLQCGQNGIEILLVVLEPLTHGMQPNVALTAGAKQETFEATVVQGGAALRLPADAAKLASNGWQNANELSVEIQTMPTAIQGTVPITGLPTALRYLSQNCHAR